MITKLENETTKQYQAICDFWRMGASRSVNALHKQYKDATSPPSRSYATLARWAKEKKWESRIADNIAEEQKLLEELYREELIKNCKRRYEVLNDMFELSQNLLFDAEGIETSVSQATNLYKTYLDAAGKVFDLDAPDKLALTDPSGKKEYSGNIDELLKLADAAKRRPDEQK